MVIQIESWIAWSFPVAMLACFFLIRFIVSQLQEGRKEQKKRGTTVIYTRDWAARIAARMKDILVANDDEKAESAYLKEYDELLDDIELELEDILAVEAAHYPNCRLEMWTLSEGMNANDERRHEL